MHGSVDFRFSVPQRHEQSSQEKRRIVQRGATVAVVFLLASVYENSHAGPAAVITPGSVPFAAASIGSSGAVKNVQIKNEGRAPLEVLGLEITGPDAADFAFRNVSCSERKL